MNVRTLGHVTPEFYDELATKLHVQWLTGQQRTNRPFSEERAEGYRKDLSLTVVRAADKAYRNYRAKVVEYTDDQTPEVQIGTDDPIAFRPALSELEENQITALRAGLYGFETRDELAEWERSVQEATFGEYAAQPVHPIAQNVRGSAYQTLRANPGDPSPSRYLLLLKAVMPSMINGVRVLRNSADEQVSNGSNGLEDQIA